MASVHETRTDVAKGWLQRLDLGAYRYAEAARLAQTNLQTITAWLRLARTERPAVGANIVERVKVLSYPQLLELAVVARFRRSGVRLADLAELHNTLVQREALRDPAAPASRHPFALRSFERDGLSLCAQAGSTLRRAVQHGQHDIAWSPLVGEFFEQVEYDERLIIRWYPRGREHGVVINPRLGFGTPTIEGSGIPTYIVAERHAAGEAIEELACDYGLSPRQISAAVAFEQALAVRAA